MKRITPSHLGKHLEAVHLSRGDLEYIESVLRKVTSTITYRYSEFEFESIDELAAHSPDVVDKLEVLTDSPYLLVDFGTRSVWLYTPTENLEARGVYAELREFLEDKCVRSVGIRKSILENFGMLGAIVGTYALIERHFAEAAMAWAIMPITLGLNLFGPSRSRINLSNIKQGFWARNSDNFIAGIVSSALVTLAAAIIQLAFSDAKG